MKKYLLILMSFFMVILGITSFSNVENEKVPNELIINNPKKEVTTIESLKNREHGEMNISVTKINPIPITGIERDGKLEFELPEKVELEENIFVTDDVNKIQEHRTLKLNKNLTTFSLENQTEKTKLKVDKPSDSKKIYIAVKEQDKIKRVYENTYMNYDDTNIGDLHMRLDGRVYLDNLYDRNFNKVITSQNYYIGKDGKGNIGSVTNGTKFDLTIETGVSEYPVNNIIFNGNPEFDYFYISDKSKTIKDRDYYYNTSGDFGLVLKKSINNLWWMAQGIDSDGNKLKDVPGCKIPKRHVRGGLVANAFDTFKVATKYTSNKEYYFTTKVYHAGDDISTFTANVNIDMTNEFVGKTININGKFNRRERSFINCLYNQIDSLPIYENKHANVIASVMTVEENNRKVGDSGVIGPSIYPKFKVMVANEYEFNYYHEWNSAYGDNLNFTITKLGENIGDKTYTIKVYSGRDYHILLGVLNLTIKNGVAPEPPKPVDIGSIIFNVDRRFVNRWIYGDEKASKTLDNNKDDYKSLIKVNKFTGLSSTQITNVKVENNSSIRSQIIKGIKYEIFRTSWGEIAIPSNINMYNLNDNIAIYSNGRIPSDEIIKLELTGLDNKKYLGNIRVIGKGSEIKRTTATLDLSKWELSNKDRRLYWNNFPKEIIYSGSFFRFESELNYGSILTELRVMSNLTENQKSTRLNDGSIEVKLINNRIGVNNSNFYFNKDSNLTKPITYTIEGYHKDILLGITTIVITNQKNFVESIGDTIFNIDRRFVNHWIYGDEKASKTLNNYRDDYSPVIKVDQFKINTGSSIITDVKLGDKINDRVQKIGNVNYKIFKTSWGEIALPTNIVLSKFNENIAIYSNNNKTLNNETIKIELIDSNGNKYIGNIKVIFNGVDAKNTVAKLNLSKWKIDQWGSWNYPNKKATSSEGQSANLIGDTFFYWKSSVKTTGHVLTKLKITEGDNEVSEATNPLANQTLEINFTNNKIGIDSKGLFIYKKTTLNKPITYVIEGYYKDIFLGKTTLSIINQKNSFELIGDGTLDFGNMIYDLYNPYYRKEKIFKVKNPSNAKLRFRVENKKGTITNSQNSETIALGNITVTKKSDINGESSFLLGASAKVEKNTKPGKYTGEIQVIVDIDGTGK